MKTYREKKTDGAAMLWHSLVEDFIWFTAINLFRGQHSEDLQLKLELEDLLLMLLLKSETCYTSYYSGGEHSGVS